MDLDSSYDWHPGSGGGSSWIKPWMAVALILSAAVHGGLYFWFQQVVVPQDAAPTRSAIESLKDLKVQGVVEDKPKPDEAESTDAADKEAIMSAQDIVQPPVDPYELQKELPDAEIRLKPGEELPPLPGSGGAVGPSDIASVLGQDSAELAKELERLTRMMMAKAPVASPDQLVIRTGASEDEIFDDTKLLEEYNRTLAKMSKVGTDVTQGFSNLDELLTRTGPILDKTKPILMPTDLLFSYNEHDLRESARLSLMKLGLLIQKNPRSTFIIEGHTDTTGPADYNMILSERRAQSVKNWLAESLALGTLRIQTRAFGESQPLANPTGSKEDQAINRRVEIVIKPPKS